MLLSKVPDCFRARRAALTRAHPDAVFILPANGEAIRNSDVHYPFRQDSSFYYLTGFDEPDAFLVLSAGKAVLFVRARDPEREMWEGERYGVEGARSVFGADEAYLISELEHRLPELVAGRDQVFYRVNHSEAHDRRVLPAISGRRGAGMPPLSDPSVAVGELRLFKSTGEIAALRQACAASAEAHRAAMEQARPGMNEAEIGALIEYGFRRGGCQRLGYNSIVAGGASAACLHYHFNNQTLKDGDLLLVDAGGERDYYTADITRTFPVGRRFTDTQARAYDLVLSVQKSAIAMTKPGVKLPDIHKHVCEGLIEGLLTMGLLQGDRDELVKSNAFRRYYPHGTSHWLGMDVHDAGLYQKNGEPRALEPGMCFTIEPGFYVQPGDQDTPAEYRGIGIRIEDDILVTENSCENLTARAPKERVEIEAIRGGV